MSTPMFIFYMRRLGVNVEHKFLCFLKFRNTYGNKRNHGLAATTKLALHNAPCSLEKMKPFKACKSQPTRKVISFEKPNENR